MRRFPFFIAVLFIIPQASHARDTTTTTQITSALVEGDNVDGVGAVETIENLAINSKGDWMAEALTDFPNTDQDGVIVINGDVLLREGITGGVDAPADTFADFFDAVSINDTGNGGFNIFIDPLPGTEDSGVYWNDMLVIQESDIATAPGLSNGTPYLGFFDTKINNDDVIMIVASIDDPAINSTVDRAIILADTVAGTQSLIAREGELLPGQLEIIDDFGTGPHSSAFNNNADVLFIAELSGDTATDNAIYLNQNLLAQEGSFSPDKARTYEFLADRGLDLNDDGDYVFKANLSGDPTSDDVIIMNDEIFRQEGDAAIDGFTFTGFGASSGPIRIGNNGNVLWFGEFNDPNPDTDSGLFINDTLVVREGVTKIDGLVVDTINDNVDAFALSSEGNWAIFEGTLTGGINGAFLIAINTVLLGDVNLDGSVDLLDVQPLVNIIVNGNFQAEADTNCDGTVNLLDVNRFIEILTGG